MGLDASKELGAGFRVWDFGLAALLQLWRKEVWGYRGGLRENRVW